MASYRVVWRTPAERDLRKLPRKYSVVGNTLVVEIVKAGHRREVYR